MKSTSTGSRGGRPMAMSTRGVVSSGHYLATQIGIDILRRGGNAADAAVGVGFALSLLKPHMNGIAGEVPTLIYSKNDDKVWSVSGNGVAPREATLERYRGYGIDIIPGDGFLPMTVPSAVATYLLVLRRFGTMRLADVLAPAVELAETGVPMYGVLRNSIAGISARFLNEWPSSRDVFMPGGQPLDNGAIWKQPQWAATFRLLIEADEGQADRDAGIRAAHDVFYRGKVAETIVGFCRSTPARDASGEAHAGLVSAEDMASFEARIEEPVSTDYRGVTVHKCGPWTQGPVLLQALNLVEGYDLASMGHNTPDYIHTVVECVKLAFADREFHYGDPDFADVPLGRLLSKEYASERRALVDPTAASMQLRPGDYPALHAESILDVNAAFEREATEGWHGHLARDLDANAARSGPGDTTKLEIIDAEGNAISATPSGGWFQSSPVVPGLGFPLGTRGQMFSLVEGHPNCLAPGKRPRSTLTPSLATRDGRPWMTFGSPGGDCQDQWALQFFLNVVEFGMNLQEAVEAPSFWSLHAPNSFYPRKTEQAVVCVERRVPEEVRRELAERGHKIRDTAEWSGGNTLATSFDPETGLRCAAASPRLEPATAAGW